MKKIFFLYFILNLALSCQNIPKDINTPPKTIIPAVQYQEQIKSDKKKQAELDLPFRGFNSEKNIKTIAFGTPETNCWEVIEKNNPELMILISAPEKNLVKLPEYRSIREKIPFMCTPYTETKSDFIKNWPYVKTIIPDSQDGIYHSKIFGTKKNQIQIIMIDQFDTDLKWAWLESQFKKPTALKILTSPTQQRDKLIELIKKSGAKNTILLPNDRPVTTFEKTVIKNFGSIYETPLLTTARAISNEEEPIIFGLIKINWNDREAQLEIRTKADQKVQVVNLKF